MPKKRQVHENLVKFHCSLPAETKQRLQDYADSRDETAARVLANLIETHLPEPGSAIILSVLEAREDKQVDLEEWLRNHE
jgi:hypothetical protein